MATSRATGWPSDGPTAAQLKEFFAQIENGRISKESLQSFLRDNQSERYWILQQPLEFLGWNASYVPDIRARNRLELVGIQTIGDLVAKAARELMAIPNFGDKSLEVVRAKLKMHELTLRGDESPAAVSVEPTPVRGLTSAVDQLFELCIALDKKADLTHKIAEHHEAERRWAAEEASGSWGGEVAGAEGREMHRRDAAKLSDELSDTSADINRLVHDLKVFLRDDPDAY